MGEWVYKVRLRPSQDDVKAIYTGGECASDMFPYVGI
jgi:hypothetical protein